MRTQILPKGFSFSSYLAKSTLVDVTCRKLLLKKMKDIKWGSLTIVDGTDNSRTYQLGEKKSEIETTIFVKRTSFFSRAALGGSIGAGESYVDGDWTCSNLPNLIRIMVRNRNVLENMDNRFGNILLPVQKVMHGLRSNTVEGSKKNIRDHYDIGNDFFQLFLDETMMYSSALFQGKERSLKEASIAKIKTICDKLELKDTDHLVEIGTGWGSLAIYAAENYGCKVTTTTISREQYEFTKKRITEKNLTDKITLLFEDYRHLTGKFDKLVSVEMIEAVGIENLPVYFEKCSSLLKPSGLMVIQAITIREQFYESAKNSVDFIQKHIFPGGALPSIWAMMDCIKDNTDLMLLGQEDFAEDYADTLSQWMKNLEARKEEVVKLGYPEFLFRLWEFYFAYCEGGFRERAIGLSQLKLAKPQFR